MGFCTFVLTLSFLLLCIVGGEKVTRPRFSFRNKHIYIFYFILFTYSCSAVQYRWADDAVCSSNCRGCD